MKWLGDQIHALGLKFGMYGAMGYGQCCSGSADNTADDGSGCVSLDSVTEKDSRSHMMMNL